MHARMAAQVQREAIQAVEQDGIVFIDEIDKIVVSTDLRYGDPSYWLFSVHDYFRLYSWWPASHLSLSLPRRGREQ
jgi:hypothetical protein